MVKEKVFIMQDIRSLFTCLEGEAKRIFNIVRNNGPLTKNSLLSLTNMKLSTLNRVIQPLLIEGLIVQSGNEESTGGRKPSLFDIDSKRFFVIGIDISRTYTYVVLSNLKMKILSYHLFTMDVSCIPEKTVSIITDTINTMISNINITKEDIIGVGLGVVGPLDRNEGIIINPDNFEAPGWSNVHIKTMLEERLNLPVITDNGANCAVLLESNFGYGKGLNSVAYFNCGIGIRTGVISSGNIIRTINNIEDSFGHMVIDVDGEKCHCGNYGCIECYSSAAGILRKYCSEIKKGRRSIGMSPEDIHFTDVCIAAEQGDDLAKEVIINAGIILGTGLANYINLLNPDLMILSGPLVKISNLYYDTAVDIAINKSFFDEEHRVRFKRFGFYGDYTICLGAAAMFTQELLAD